MRQTAKNLLRAIGVLDRARRYAWARRIRKTSERSDIETLPFRGNTRSEHLTVRSLPEFEDYCRTRQNELECRCEFELAIAGRAPVVVAGRSSRGRRRGEYYVPAPTQLDPASSQPQVSLREGLIDLQTGFPSRIRAVLHSIDRLVPLDQLNSSPIFLSEQTTGLFNYFKRKYPKVIGSEYLGPDKQPGSVVAGVRHEDLCCLSFPDGKFGTIVVLEVLEHIPAYKKALPELARILQPGGVALITVPFLHHQDKNLIRARVGATGEIEHLLPPDYHGDPVRPEQGILCFQYFGWDLLRELTFAGFKEAAMDLLWSADDLLLGENLCVIYARK